jgi:hypothetical protein
MTGKFGGRQKAYNCSEVVFGWASMPGVAWHYARYDARLFDPQCDCRERRGRRLNRVWWWWPDGIALGVSVDESDGAYSED